jgi:hypothetical protein
MVKPLTPEEAAVLIIVLERAWIPTQGYDEFKSALLKLKLMAMVREDEHVKEGA